MGPPFGAPFFFHYGDLDHPKLLFPSNLIAVYLPLFSIKITYIFSMTWNITILSIGVYFYLGMNISVPAPTIEDSMPIDSLIASYYLNGNVDDELDNYSGSINGAELTSDRFSSTMSAFRFDGAEENLNLGVDFTESIDSLSISMWIYPYTSCEPSDTMSIDSTMDQYFLSSGGVGASTGIYGIWNQGSLLVGQSLAASHTAHEYHTFLDDSTWHHLVLFFDAINENASIYINGSLAYTLDHIVESSTTAIDSLLLGNANFEEGNGFFGKVDDVKLYNRKISDTDIGTLFKEGCPDTLQFANLHIQKDTALYAHSQIEIDTLKVDSACNLDLITPYVQLLDSTYLYPIASINVQNMDGCRHDYSIHDKHVTHRGIYINNFVTDGILGNALKEDSLINWCLHQDFNNMYLYNIGSALSSGMQVELDSFVHKANNLSLEVTFVSAGFGTSFDNIVTYHEDYPNIPQGIVSEIEFWNGAGDYDADYVPWLERLDSLKFIPPSGESSPLNPDIQKRFYIGKIKNPGQPPSISIAEDLISHHDEIFLTNYHSDAYNLSTSSSENSIRNKLSLMAEAAKNLEKEVNVVILFNVRQDSPAPNIWSYFSEDNADHDFRAGYEKWYHDFLNASDIDNKEYINLKGYGVYRWTDAKEARTDYD